MRPCRGRYKGEHAEFSLVTTHTIGIQVIVIAIIIGVTIAATAVIPHAFLILASFLRLE